MRFAAQTMQRAQKRELRIGYPGGENLNDAATLRLGIRTVAFSMPENRVGERQ
jgi:hypothetical protein